MEYLALYEKAQMHQTAWCFKENANSTEWFSGKRRGKSIGNSSKRALTNREHESSISTKVGCYYLFSSDKFFLQIGQILYVPRDPINKK